MGHIPVVDFEAYGLLHPLPESAGINTHAFRDIAKRIDEAFQKIGFVYLKNTGVPTEQLDAVLKTGDAFFSLPEINKAKYRRNQDTDNGWVPLMTETPNLERPGDVKECYNVLPSKTAVWPTREIPNFRDVITTFFNTCTELALRVLDVISYSRNLEDTCHLRRYHDISGGKTSSTLRLSWYHSLTDLAVKPGQARIGEHTDYGSITLLFQDQVGGLEVKCRDGIYRPATPIPGTVIVNIGDLMQRWTSDVLIANFHRVLVPRDDARRNKTRKSVVFFVRPDDNCTIECLDGSNKYPPVKALDYLQAINNKTYE